MQRYTDTLEQAVSAEGLGFESVWPVEQHFNQPLSALPCPAIILAAIAARTKTLRLGTAIVLLPLGHPLRIAEEIATLDVLSGGRVEFGVGRGAIPKHYANFGVPLLEGRERMIEGLDYIKRAFTQDRFSFQGRFYQAENVCLVPKPVQQPYPPIRIATNGVETLEFAGREGYPILMAAHLNPLPRLAKLLPIYRAARKAGGRSEVIEDDISILIPLYVDESESEVRKWAGLAVRTYADLTASNLAAVAEKLNTEADRKNMELAAKKIRELNYDEMNTSMAIFGTPQACLERLKALRESLNPGRVICWFNFMGAIPHDHVMRSMMLFASKVLPNI